MRDFSATAVDRLDPQADGSRTSKHWGFQVDLPANQRGPGWRRHASTARRRFEERSSPLNKTGVPVACFCTNSCIPLESGDLLFTLRRRRRL